MAHFLASPGDQFDMLIFHSPSAARWNASLPHQVFSYGSTSLPMPATRGSALNLSLRGRSVVGANTIESAEGTLSALAASAELLMSVSKGFLSGPYRAGPVGI